MPGSDIVERLAQHRTLGSVPRKELEWLAAHGTLQHVERGDYVARRSEPLENLIVVLSGHFAIYVDRGLGPRKVMEWRAGDVSGLLPYSRLTNPPGDTVIDEPGDLLFVHRSHFPEMTRECPAVTAELVHVMLDRARRFTSSDLQDEKMSSLGRLSAGLAHELNNPASAAARSAKLLFDSLAPLEDASRALGAARLSDAQVDALKSVRKVCGSGLAATLSPIERADREEALSEWLEAHGSDVNAAGVLVDTSIGPEDLDALAAALEPPVLNTAVQWIAAECSARALAGEVQHAASRIHDLVAAVKRFTYMDRVDAPEAIDLATNLGDTVSLLQHKARTKSVAVKLTLDPKLPRVRAIGGDLSQVWMNLIDNAIDAAPESGHVTIEAAPHLEFVIVRVIDDGPGIPGEIKEKIFDPFYTTKPVGQGTGLGLDIAMRLVRRNGGDMEVESRPGHTEFRVTLPAANG